MTETGADAVRERAYQIWELEGRPHGRDFDHWLQAERELSTSVRGPKRSRTRKSTDPTALKRTTAPRTKKTH